MALMLESIEADSVTIRKLRRNYDVNGNVTKYRQGRLSYESFGKAHDVMGLFEYDIQNPAQTLRSNQALVEVEASTVSKIDCLIRENLFRKSVNFPYTPGTDMVGKVVACGKKASKYGITVNSRVAALDIMLGGHSKYVNVSVEKLIKVPERLESAECACLIRSYVAAYQCLFRVGDKQFKEDDYVFVKGGNGCVGQALIQLANLTSPGRVYASASENHHSYLKSLGAHPLPRESHAWKDLSKKVDIVVDASSGDEHECLSQLLSPNGSRLIHLGARGERQEELGYGCCSSTFLGRYEIFRTERNTFFYDVYESKTSRPVEYTRDLTYVMKLLQNGLINPKISATVSLLDVANCHEMIDCDGVSGHIICLPQLSSETTKPLTNLTSISAQERNELSHKELAEGMRVALESNATAVVLKSAKGTNLSAESPSTEMHSVNNQKGGSGRTNKMKTLLSFQLEPENRITAN